MAPTARLMALLIAAVASGALVAQAVVSSRLLGMPDVAHLVWVMAAYFTVLVNLLIAMAFGWFALSGRTGTAGWHSGLVMWISTVGLIYHTLLAGVWAPQGLAWWADQALHTATPMAVWVWWLAFAPKAPLRGVHPWLWSVLPLVYCGYALLRGHISGAYAYPFIDMAALGPLRTALNAAGLTLGFVLGGYGLLVVARGLQGFARSR